MSAGPRQDVRGLVLMLLQSGRVMTPDELAEGVYGAERPRTWKDCMYNHVKALRALGWPVLSVKRPGAAHQREVAYWIVPGGNVP